MKISDIITEAVKQRLDAKCWAGKHKEGTKIKGGVSVNNCVPNESVKEGLDNKAEASLGTVLSWPAVANKVSSAMRAMGWKVQRKDDDSFMFSTAGQESDDQYYIIVIENEGDGMFHYALGTFEGGRPDIGEEASLPTTEASVSELMTAIREGYGLNEGLTPDQMFDIIEEMVEQVAAEHGVDSELIWEDFDSVDDHELFESAAWQRKAGKNKKGGLNAKGVASYRRENPGSKLQTAVTTKPSKLKPGSKAAKRRKSFCARMGGMKGAMKKDGKPTRKALALRKWNC